MPRARKKVTPRTRDKILLLYKEGWSYAHIAKQLKMSAWMVKRVTTAHEAAAAPAPAPREAAPAVKRAVPQVVSGTAKWLMDENKWLRKMVGEQAVEIMLLKHQLEGHEGAADWAASSRTFDLNEAAHA